jgi:cell division protein FtsI/penicillin-binding protein 2
MTISRNYPFSDIYTHVLGYVSQPNEKDILANKIIQERFVPGIKIGKLGLEKTLENDLIGINDIQRYEVNAVLDWELSTLGHPYSDLAYQCMQLRMPQVWVLLMA